MSAPAIGVMIGSMAMFTLCVLLGLYARDWCEDRRIPYEWAMLGCIALLLAASLLTTSSAYRLDTVSEVEPTPAPVCDCSYLLAWMENFQPRWDTVTVNIEEMMHYWEACTQPVPTPGTIVPTPGMTEMPYQTVVPTSMPTQTATPTILCKRCEYESDCGPGYRCVRCSDMRSRCVRLDSPNGDCQNCVNAGK